MVIMSNKKCETCMHSPVCSFQKSFNDTIVSVDRHLPNQDDPFVIQISCNHYCEKKLENGTLRKPGSELCRENTCNFV